MSAEDSCGAPGNAWTVITRNDVRIALHCDAESWAVTFATARALRAMANAAAALACRGPGAQGALPDRDALEAFAAARARG